MEPTEAQIAKAPAQRIDWRTGKPMPQHDDAFWQDHDRRRREAGLSVPQYCTEHGLALSTYRHRVHGVSGIPIIPSEEYSTGGDSHRQDRLEALLPMHCVCPLYPVESAELRSRQPAEAWRRARPIRCRPRMRRWRASGCSA